MTNSKYNAHPEPLFKQIKILKFEDIFIIQQYEFYLKFINNELPHYFLNHIFKQYYTQHDDDTRLRLYLEIPWKKHNFMKKGIRVIPDLINNSPDIKRNKVFIHSLKGFAKYIKIKFLLIYRRIFYNKLLCVQ